MSSAIALVDKLRSRRHQLRDIVWSHAGHDEFGARDKTNCEPFWLRSESPSDGNASLDLQLTRKPKSILRSFYVIASALEKT